MTERNNRLLEPVRQIGTAAEQIAESNARLAVEGKAIRWIGTEHGLKLVGTAPQARADRLSIAELVGAYRYLGESILRMGVKCGDLVEGDCDRVRQASRDTDLAA